MKRRDLVIVGAVAVLVGLAAFDAVRGGGGDDGRGLRARSSTAPTPTVAAESLPRPLPRGVLSGSLVFTEIAPEGPRTCRLRLVHLATGGEREFPQDTAGCSLSVAPTGSAVAKSLGDVFDRLNMLPYRIIDPERPGRGFGEVRAREGLLAWSLDGRRVLWCGFGPSGYELELGRAVRSFRVCANGYSTDGNRFYLKGRRLFVGRRLALERPAGIDQAAWSANGSVALVVGGRRLERWSEWRLTGEARVPQELAFRPIHFSPDNCAAVVLGDREVHVVDLGCFRGRDSFVTASPDNCIDRRSAVTVRCFRWDTPSSFSGNAATWSPDGNWIAVVEEDAISFHRLVGRYETLRWDVRAAALAWR